MNTVFSEYSLYYDLLYKDKNYKVEASYVEDLIKKYNPNTKSILDFGCGTGKHDYYLIQKGYDVFGVDMSETMLDFAKALNIPCTKGDVRTYRDSKKYDCVASLFHVASYQTTDEDIFNFFKTISYHLKKGGICIFDVWYKPAVLFQKPEDRIKELENEEVKVKRICRANHLEEQSVVEVNYEIEIKNKKNNKINYLNELHRMRYYSKEELEHFAGLAGIKLLLAEEPVTKKEPSKDTWGVCFVGVKEWA